MSIYATHWLLKFPRYGDAHSGCGWITVIGQGVPAHIGTPTAGYGYESGDPYASFLPPPLSIDNEDDEVGLRAMVIVSERTEKVGQEYIGPLLILSGEEYAAIPFQVLHERICDALRGTRPGVVAEIIDGTRSELLFEDGTYTMNPAILALHHVQLAMPRGQENTAREFYCGVLGFVEVPKPAHLAARGGAWFRSGSAEVHLGVEDDFRPAMKAHPALLVENLPELAARCHAAGFTPTTDQPLPGFDRVYVTDPFGNRIELLEPSALR